MIGREQTGSDPFGVPIYEETETPVENVLIAPTTSDDIIDDTDLDGRRAAYTLAIPKGDTHEWANQKVKFFGETWQVFGTPLKGIESNIPLDWNKKVTVEKYEG